MSQSKRRQRVRAAKIQESKFSPQWMPVPNPNPEQYPGLTSIDITWKNNTHLVMVEKEETEFGTVDHLWIQRNDGRPERDWEKLQWIKNQMCSPLREGVEFYPNEALKVNERNIYHIYVFPPGVELPFGMKKAMDKEIRLLKETMLT